MDYQTRNRLYRREYQRALTANRRAQTIHNREQAAGLLDMSAQQTRRMCLAANRLSSTAGRLARAHRDLYGR